MRVHDTQVWAAIASFFVFAIAISGCNHASSVTKPPVLDGHDDSRQISKKEVILDFENAETGVEWVEDGQTSSTQPGPTTQKGGIGNGVLSCSAARPNTGLWCLKANLGRGREGQIVHRFDKPVPWRAFDVVTAAVMDTATAERSGEYMARLFVVDEAGKKSFGDPLPVTGRWQDLLLDLKTAGEEGVNVSQIAAMGIELKVAKEGSGGGGPLEVQTDTWTEGREYRGYLGERGGKGMFVEREGTALHVGMEGHYEVTFYQRSGAKRPWFEVKQAGWEKPAIGTEGTGLMLLDQDRYDGLGTAVRQDAYSAVDLNTLSRMTPAMPSTGWPVAMTENGPSEESRWRWECVWTSPVAAIVEVKQETGPYDRLGAPAVRVTWRFMIYQWGQIFVHAQWERSETAGASRPMSWALVQDDRENLFADPSIVQAKTPADADRLLNAIYPVSVKDGLETALPHEMQRGAAVAMIAKSVAATSGAKEKNLWWWTKSGGKRIFGVGLGRADATSADCMLLVNKPTALMQAGSFAQYLVPPKIKVREGELDRNFPGDVDNDGLVDSYGFQVIRLANGRATFMVYPQERPLFYPPYLFTVPAVEREKVDLKHSRLLVNIDGKQFADPPQFPDGSFLLQLPYVIDRPVQVEAVLVPR